MRIAQPQHRGNAHVEDRVIGVAMDDLHLAGNRNGATRIPLTEIAVDRQKVLRMIMEGAAHLRLQR